MFFLDDSYFCLPSLLAVSIGVQHHDIACIVRRMFLMTKEHVQGDVLPDHQPSAPCESDQSKRPGVAVGAHLLINEHSDARNIGECEWFLSTEENGAEMVDGQHKQDAGGQR